MILWLLACTATEPKLDTARLTDATTPVQTTEADTATLDTSSGPTSTATTSSTRSPTTDTSPFHGKLLKPPLSPPAFAVVNHDGDERTPEWLAGAPTVLWFYRDASDAG